MMGPKVRIALLTHASSGGVRTVTHFLTKAITLLSGSEISIIELATSSNDATSVRLLSPPTWRRGIRVLEGKNSDFSFRHVGAHMTEFEFQRYRPRPWLTRELNRYDLIQIVAGTPAWAFVTRDISRPCILFTASTIKNDQASSLQHATGLERVWRSLMTEINFNLEQKALQKMDLVMAESEYTLELLKNRIPGERLALGVPGVDINAFYPNRNYNEHGDLLWVGRLSDPRKNLGFLLRAYRRFLQYTNDAPNLTLAGRGNLPGQYSALINELGLRKKINTISDIQNSELARIYREASIFILSSDEEGLGMVILEAMSSGLPVISTDCGGPRTAIVHGETGLLVPVGEQEVMADAISTLWANPTIRRRMGSMGRRRIEEVFSIEKAGAIYLDHYRLVLEKKKVS